MGTQFSKESKYGSVGNAQNIDLLITGYLRQHKASIINHMKYIIKQYYPKIYKIFGTGYGSQFGDNAYINQKFERLFECEQLICNVDDIYCIGHTFFVHDTVKDELYSIGSNHAGQCGVGWTKNRREQCMMGMSHWVDHADKLTKIEFKFINNNKFTNDEYIQIISNGTCSDHTFVMTNKNRFYAWGDNGRKQISIEDEKHFITPVFSDRIYKVLADKNIIKIATGTSHTLLLSHTGNVYGYGRNDHGCCGFDADKVNIIDMPKLIEDLNNIGTIKCSRDYSVLLSRDKEMIVFGTNSCGQLGLGKTHHYCDKPLVHNYFKNKNKICFIDCCCENTLCIDENGRCYLFGGNMNGQCGTENEEYGYNIKVPFCIQSHNSSILKNIKFISGSCGISHTVLFTDKKQIYAFGSNVHGQVNPVVDYGSSSIKIPMLLSKKNIGVDKKFMIERVMTGLDSTIIIGY